MRTIFLSLLAISLLFVSEASAAYKLYLKNGKTIQGISSYEKEGGEIRFNLGAGTIGIPEKDVLKIEEYNPGRDEIMKEQIPTQKAPSTAPASPRQKRSENSPDQKGVSLKNKIANIDRQLDEISKREKDYRDLKDQLNQVNLRIEVLYKKGREAAMARGKSQVEAQQQYQQFLTSEDRSLVQMNFMKKHELERKIQDMEADPSFQADLAEKQKLLEERERLNSELTNLQTGTNL